MRIRVSGIFLFVCITTCLSLAIDRPQTPTIDDVDFDGQTITIWGSKDDGDSCHAVLITDLTVPFQYGNDISRSELGSDGAAINWAQENFPMNIKIGNKSVERYYLAVVVSKKNDDKQSVFSGWRVYTDDDGLPIPITTAADTSVRETFFRRARKIKSGTSQVILDLSFSLPKAKASDYSLKIKGTTTILDISDLNSISQSEKNVKEAINGVTLINDKSIVLKDTSGSFNLYNIYTFISDYSSSDSLSVSLIDGSGLVSDTFTNRACVFEDSSYTDIFSTIYNLLRMDSTVTDPIYPGGLGSISSGDTVKAKVLICAMLDHSLSHNSPLPKSIEASQGIFTNYIQFMDNVARNWGTIRTSENGIQRLKKIHEKVLQWNKESVIDPVYVKNHGTVLDYDTAEQKRKRKNYAFYEGYTRLYYECEFLDYSSFEPCGAGIMFRISDNIELYTANMADTFNMFSEPFLGIDSTQRRLIIPVDDSLILNAFDNGLWVRGRNAKKEEETYYTGICAVRLPIQNIADTKPINTPFENNDESAGLEDPQGLIAGKMESNIFKMYALKLNPDNTEDTLYNVPDPEVLIHHERRIIEIDSNFAGSNASFSFHVIGEDSTEKKIFIEPVDEYRAVIRDTSQTSGKTQVRVSNNGLLSYVGEKWILVSKIFSVEAENGNLLKNGLVGHPFELSIVNVDSLRINEIDQMDDEGFVTISTSPRVVILEKNSELGFDLWGDFAKVSGRRVMQKKWGEYKEMLSGKSLLYFYTDRGGLHNIDINLSWPGSITRNISSNTSESPVNSYIAENITFNMKFDNIVLEPVTNEIVSGTLAEVYNPSVVVLNETASFKIEVSGVESEMVSWRSENEKVKFLNGSIESDIGIGKTVKVKGNSLGEDKLIVDIEGYDGRSPEISFDVLNWKNINVYTCIVKDELNKDSAFTDSEIDDAIDKGNEIFKQIGVKMIRKKYVDSVAYQDKYFILPSVETMKELINIKGNTIDGVEIYFVAGQTFDQKMIAEAYYEKGIVITKYGRIREGEPLKIRFSPYMLSHEVLHCMRTDASTDECVADIYDYYWVGNKKESIPDNTDIAESHIPLDWGTGYYRSKTELSDVIKRLLMYGYNIENRFDIPRGDVLGFDKYNVAKHVKCGGIVELKDRSFRNDY